MALAMEVDEVLNFNITKGFTNFGNTCFYNATLQSIFRCKKLIEKLKNYVGENKLLKFLQITIKDYYLSPHVEVIGPSLLLRSYRQMNANYQHGSQEDARECLTYFLDNFDMATTAEGLDIKKLFDYNLKSVIECPICHNKVESNADEKVILLPISNHNNLNDALEQFLSEEKLDGNNKWKCEKCDKHVEANKRLIINGTPEYLYISLKRFEQEYIKELNKIRIRRINTEIDMPNNFILNHADYKLTGIIIQYGGLDGGHYVYYHKMTNEWKLFNDERLSSENNEDRIKKSGYIYLYEKQ
jgi:ubiquitin carboxyl-terminal hydrolase 36/42